MASRTERIRRQSENYGVTFCTQHGPSVAMAVSAWRAGNRAPGRDVPIRVYNPVSNVMATVTLIEVLDDLPLRDGRPLNPRPTACGQVMLRPDLSISTSIYHMVLGAWYLTAERDEIDDV